MIRHDPGEPPVATGPICVNIVSVLVPSRMFSPIRGLTILITEILDQLRVQRHLKDVPW